MTRMQMVIRGETYLTLDVIAECYDCEVEWVERVYDVRRWTDMPRGGHFAAMEEPALLAEDIRAFFRPLR